MTTTTPPSGTPEPGSGDGETARQEPGKPVQNPLGNPPPEPAQQPSTADASSGASDSYAAILAEHLGADAETSARKRRRSITVGVAGIVLGTVFTLILGYFFIGFNVPKENEEQKKHDASQPPFTASVRPEKSEPNTWVMILDRELTAHETRTMTSKQDSSSTFVFLRSLGGRPLTHAAILDNAPVEYQRQRASGQLPLADPVMISLLSTRSYAVVVDGWDVVNITCTPSTAKTVVSYPPQGEASYTGVRLHIPPLASEPVLVDETEGQGEPYFNNRFIELGGGLSPAGLRVEAIAPPGQSCEWGVMAHYVDAHQNEQAVLLKDSKGNPLRIRTESVPFAPRQKWVFGSVPWTACHEKPRGSLCDL